MHLRSNGKVLQVHSTPTLRIYCFYMRPHTKVNSAKWKLSIDRPQVCASTTTAELAVTSMNKSIMMYTIVKIPVNQYISTAGVSTRCHQQQFLVPFYSINAYSGSYFPTAILPSQASPYQHHHCTIARPLYKLIYRRI